MITEGDCCAGSGRNMKLVSANWKPTHTSHFYLRSACVAAIYYWHPRAPVRYKHGTIPVLKKSRLNLAEEKSFILKRNTLHEHSHVFGQSKQNRTGHKVRVVNDQGGIVIDWEFRKTSQEAKLGCMWWCLCRSSFRPFNTPLREFLNFNLKRVTKGSVLVI